VLGRRRPAATATHCTDCICRPDLYYRLLSFCIV